MNKAEMFLEKKLSERKTAGNIRSLRTTDLAFDFVSNDYLGLARNQDLFEIIQARINHEGIKTNGSGGSRLLSGNHRLTEELEAKLAKLFKSEACLLFNSGYNANMALISSVAQKGDTILYDQLSHVCLKEGAWLSQAESIKFFHNDLGDLEKKLKQAKGNKFIVTESVFSMDGDFSPIEEIIKLAKNYEANIIIDEAHSTGCFGKNGSGWLCEKGIENEVFATVYTFGKGMGTHGACVCGSQTLIDYLINFGRSFIYTTALPIHSIITIDEAFKYLASHPNLQTELQEKIKLFTRMLCAKTGLPIETQSQTAIQPVIVPGNDKIKAIAQSLNNDGFDVRPILAPTVKSGEERLRISLHSHNSDNEIEN
jgi:8-amino-7-oxononanoate synthase